MIADNPHDIEAYNYDLPEDLIAQEPAVRRDASRLLVMDCHEERLRHGSFPEVIDLFAAGDVLVLNDTRVFPARLLGKKESGGGVELLLTGYPQQVGKSAGSGSGNWQEAEFTGLVRSSKRPRLGNRLLFGPDLEAEVREIRSQGETGGMLYFRGDLASLLDRHGQVPLPPYIRRQKGADQGEDRERYQTVYANQFGAVAAPTAGLHFTPELLEKVGQKGVDIVQITLHVGYGTFAPVREKDIRNHSIHREYVTVSHHAALGINKAIKAGCAVWPVGTTTVRSLEFAANQDGSVRALDDWCDLYIYPGYRFKLVDRLITNFHLPRSSLLFLVSALAGRERMLRAYTAAVQEGYRFFSYGDAMAVIAESRKNPR